MVERPVDVELPQLVVPDVRRAMPAAASLFFGDPTRELDVAAITGTNGKTTSAFLLHAILEADGRRSGLLTNIERRVGGERRPTGLNTPEALDLQRLFREMADAGDAACVMEATSIAQAQGRLEGTRFAVLVFTNLTQDHLDFHGSMEAYFEAKRAMFAQAERAVINVGDAYGRALAAGLPDAITFDADDPVIDGIRLPLPGRFNRENAIGAALAARALGVGDDAIRRGIESVTGVPGRFEPIDEGQPFTVIVDYAHTPDSLDNVLGAARGWSTSPGTGGSSSSSAPAATATAQAAGDGPRRRPSSPTARSSPPTTRAARSRPRSPTRSRRACSAASSASSTAAPPSSWRSATRARATWS